METHLYILYTIPLSDMSFERILSESIACIFNLLIGFFFLFCKAKVLNLMRSNLSVFLFIDHAIDVKTLCFSQDSEDNFLLIFLKVLQFFKKLFIFN